jgi:hypothetical protein
MKWKRNDVVITEPIADYLTRIFDEEIAKGFDLKVSIGTDSSKSGKPGYYKFATVILISTSEILGGGVVVGRGGLVIHTTYYNQFKNRVIILQLIALSSFLIHQMSFPFVK